MGKTSSSASSSSRAEGTISGSGGTIKAGAAGRFPAKIGKWVKYAGSSGNTATYTIDASAIGVGFQRSAYSDMQDLVTNSRTKVGSGVCGSSALASDLNCYLKAADGVITVSTDGNVVPLVALVDFANQLTKVLGTS